MIKEREELFYELVKEDFRENGNFGYMSQMAVLVIKSLLPEKNGRGNRINYERYLKEMNLWTYYRSDYNPALVNIKKMDPVIYWDGIDDSIISRIIPIVISNSNKEIIMDEVIKNIIFTTGRLESLFEYMMMAYLIVLLLESQSYKEIIVNMKEYIINFGQNDYMEKYSRFYRCYLETYPGKIKIDFEKEKIAIINLLNGLNTNGNLLLEECISLLKEGHSDPSYFESKLLDRFINKFEPEEKMEIPNFYLNLGRYMNNLEKGRISREDLYIDKYELPDIFSFSEGDEFFHTLLNDVKVIKKIESKSKVSSLIRSKSGYYAFNKEK